MLNTAHHDKLHARQWLANNIHVFEQSAGKQLNVTFEITRPGIDKLTATAAEERVMRELKTAFPKAHFTPLINCEPTNDAVYVKMALPSSVVSILNGMRSPQQGIGA